MEQESGLVWCDFVELGIGVFDYCLQVSANRIGSKLTGGPFDLYQVKIMQ
jgi:uncharacterized protein